jgi:hypothetical protein
MPQGVGAMAAGRAPGRDTGTWPQVSAAAVSGVSSDGKRRAGNLPQARSGKNPAQGSCPRLGQRLYLQRREHMQGIKVVIDNRVVTYPAPHRQIGP